MAAQLEQQKLAEKQPFQENIGTNQEELVSSKQIEDHERKFFS
jgi:hypothetical protein